MKRILLLLLLASAFTMCKDPEKANPPIDEPGELYIRMDENRIEFSCFSAEDTYEVETNTEITSWVASTAWCETDYEEGVLTISVADNEGRTMRSATVTLKDDKNTKFSILVAQDGKDALVNAIPQDEMIRVGGGNATNFQPGEGIEKSYDGDMSTIYHSNWNDVISPSKTATLDYLFSSESGQMDYLIYNPRTDGSNGHFDEFELWVATADSPTPTLYDNYDFEGRSTPSMITFSPALQNPTMIRFVVKSGKGDSPGASFASCAEMQFFRKIESDFDFSTIFTDVTCSALKPGVGASAINNIENPFYKGLALDLLAGDYDSEFRVASFPVWQHPDVMAAQNKTGTYSLRDNPTGIYVRGGEELVVLADTKNQSAALFVQDPNRMISGSQYPLTTGSNKITPAHDGLVYIMYHNQTGVGPEVKLHFVTGHVNGYFDSQKHPKERWSELLNNATFVHFDLVGEYAHLTFETAAFRQHTPDGMALVEQYDGMVRMEQDFMGLFKYDRAFKNRMYFLVINNSSYMHAAAYYTGYDAEDAQPDILNLTKFRTSDIWGPAHEVGHVNQTRPGLSWKGMTEVTNNIHSLYVQTEFGNRSRLLGGVYTKAFTEIIDAGIAHNAHDDVFCKLVPFWQLKLYMHDALRNEDFYKDVYEAVRVKPNPATQGQCQMEFVKIACDVAELDLTDFFQAWGFLTPVELEVDDYGKASFSITEQMVNDTKAYIVAKNYPKPDHSFERITDDNWQDYYVNTTR